MQKHMLKLGVVLIVALIAGGAGGWGPLASAGAKGPKPKAPVPQTGQTECWDAVGSPITCEGTGQDGDIQAGVDWPTPRFTDRQDGTVRDNLTGLIWLKHATCVGVHFGADALHLANTLASGQCSLSDGSRAGDWRLPNMKEWQSLIDFRFSFPALSNAAGTGPWADGDAFVDAMGAAVGEQPIYWSSTTWQDLKDRAYVFSLVNGGFGVEPKGETINFSPRLVWPVRGGD